jgi:hypothetical protein
MQYFLVQSVILGFLHFFVYGSTAAIQRTRMNSSKTTPLIPLRFVALTDSSSLYAYILAYVVLLVFFYNYVHIPSIDFVNLTSYNSKEFHCINLFVKQIGLDHHIRHRSSSRRIIIFQNRNSGDRKFHERLSNRLDLGENRRSSGRIFMICVFTVWHRSARTKCEREGRLRDAQYIYKLKV